MPKAATVQSGIAAVSKPPSRMLHAVGWMAAASWSTALITWIATIAVARLLQPSDFGLIGMANIFLGFAALLSEFGLGAAMVAMPRLSEEEVSQMNTLAVISGVGLFAALCAAAYPLGGFFRTPNLPAVVIGMSVPFVITSFNTVPNALLQRDFRFKLLAQIQAVQSLGYSGSIVLAAALGAGYWSLVVGAVVGPTIATLLLLRHRRHGFAVPNIKVLRPSLAFSSHIVVSRVAWYSYSNADFVVAGRVLGQAALGAYNIAWTTASLPAQRISLLVTRVLPSYFSNVQKDEAALRAYVLNITEALLLVTLPASLGLSFLAPEVIAVTLGPKWMNSVLPLRILALYIAFRSITTLFGPLLNVRGESRFAMWNNVAAALYFPAAFYVGSRFGIVGIALVWPLLYPLVALPLCFRVFKQIHLSWRVYLASIYPALSGSLLMTAYLIAIRNVLPTSIRPYLRLSIEILTGAAVYCLAMVALHRARVRHMFILLQSATHDRLNVQGGAIAAAHVPECQPISNEEGSGLR